MTSADAAGLPIFSGLVRYDELRHRPNRSRPALYPATKRAAFVLPATHWAAKFKQFAAAPMGMRLRLKACFDVSGYSPANRVILNALRNTECSSGTMVRICFSAARLTIAGQY